MIAIGLTGGIASGKSTVSNMFKQMNIPVIDADEISRDVVNSDPYVMKEIERCFSRNVIKEDGSLDRKELGEIVFSDNKKLDLLNTIIQPVIRDKIKKKVEEYREKCNILVLDIPLLYEFAYENMVDYIIVIYVNYEYQIERLIKRDRINKVEAIKRIKAQMSLEEKIKCADYVIDNNCTVEETYNQLKTILDKIYNLEDINV